MKIKRKVVCVFGEFNETSDFVLEPAFEGDEDAFWIYKEEEEK